MSVKKHENQVYVTDLSLVTEHCAAQVKINLNCVLNLKLISTAHFVSINSHLSVSECNILNFCFLKANRYSSAALL